jgi:hypothetical protein
MKLFPLLRHANVGVLAQKRVQRGSPALLCPTDNKIYAHN